MSRIISSRFPIHFKETSDCSENKITGLSKLPLTLHERFLRIRQIVKDAIAAHHTFMIYGKSRVVRECMLQRGWCEKFFRKNNGGKQQVTRVRRATSLVRNSCFRSNKRDRLDKFLTFPSHTRSSAYSMLIRIIVILLAEQYFGVDSSPVILLGGLGELKDDHSRQLLISRMLANRTVDFLWNAGTEWPGWPSQDNKTTVFNRFYRAGFTSKVSSRSSLSNLTIPLQRDVHNDRRMIGRECWQRVPTISRMIRRHRA